MVDPSRLRNLSRELDCAYRALISGRSKAEELIDQTGMKGTAGVSESIRALNGTARWCDDQIGDINRRLSLLSEFPESFTPTAVALANATVYDARRTARRVKGWIDDKHLPTEDELAAVAREMKYNDSDSEYVDAFFKELGGTGTSMFGAMVISAKLRDLKELPEDEFAERGFKDPIKLHADALDLADKDLRYFNSGMTNALNRAGEPGAVDDKFVEDFATMGQGADQPEEWSGADGAYEREKEAAARKEALETSLTMAGVAAPVGEEIAKKSGAAKTRFVFKGAGGLIGLVSVGMLLSEIVEGDWGDKAEVAGLITLNLASLFPSPVGWLAAGILVLIWIDSLEVRDPSRLVDLHTYYDAGNPGGTKSSGGQTPYMDKAGVPKEKD